MGTHAANSSFRFGPFTLIPAERQLLRDGRPIPLTPKAFDLLTTLVAHAPRLVNKDELMQAVWSGAIVEESNLPYHVFAIRKALGERTDVDRYIETVPKQGYRFIAPVTTPEFRSATTSRRPRPDVVRFVDPPMTGSPAVSTFFQISPDDDQLAFASTGEDGLMQFWLRWLSALEPIPWPGTVGVPLATQGAPAAQGAPTFWSPDSRCIVFQAEGLLKRADIAGGPARTICEVPQVAVGGTWNAADTILFGNPNGPLLRCDASGGTATAVTAPPNGEMDLAPSFLSDGRRYLFLRISRSKPERSGMYVGDLARVPDRAPKRVIDTATVIFGGSFVPPSEQSPCAIVFVRGGDVYAQRFDEARLELLDEPVRIAEAIGSFLDVAYVSASARTLVHRGPEPDSQLRWFSRHGAELRSVGAPGQLTGLALSPSGTRALVAKRATVHDPDQDLWLFDVDRDSTPRRMTSGPSLEMWPVWISDETFVYGCGGGENGVYRQTLGGRRQQIVDPSIMSFPTSITPDGELLLFTTMSESLARFEVWAQTGAGDSAHRQPLIRRAYDQTQAVLSPDRRWVAYVSNENGPNEVFVAALRYDAQTSAVSADGGVSVSRGGGFAPRWHGNSCELFYLTNDGTVMSTDVGSTPDLGANEPKRLFRAPGVLPEWGVTHDGQRFLFAVPLAPPPPFHFVLNWQSLLGD